MDEPLSALDRRTKGEKLRDHFALPIFYITHDMTVVERLADFDLGDAGVLQQLRRFPSGPLAVRRASEGSTKTRHSCQTSDQGE